jgi:hypothetical protein
MEKESGSSSKSSGFWTTLPGLLTAVATLLTAIVGSLAALHQLGYFKQQVKPDPNIDIQKVTSSPSPSPALLSTSAEGVTYTIIKSIKRPYAQNEFLLVLTMKISAVDNSVSAEDKFFRLDVDGIKLSPHTGLSSHWIPLHSDWKEEVKFVVPADAQSVSLVVGLAGTNRTATIPLSLNSISQEP